MVINLKTTVKSKIFKLLTIILILELGYLVINKLYSSYKYIDKASFNTDEYAWVYDSQIYQQRMIRNYEIFNVSEKNLRSNWASIDYRVVDQPQMGKYIFGYLISKSESGFNYQNVDKWFDSEKKEFGRFGDIWSLTGGKSPSELRTLINENWLSIIIELRQYSFFMFLFFLFIHGIFIFRIFRSVLLSIISIAIFVFNPLLEWFSQVASMDMFSLFFLYLSFILIFTVFSSYGNKSLKKKTIIICFAGIFTAISSSIKLNGLFLLLIPLLYIFFDIYNIEVKNKKIDIRTNILLMAIFDISFLLIFAFLEPEILINPLNGFKMLVAARIRSQYRFLHAESYNIFEYLGFLFKNYSNIFGNLLLSIFVFLLSILGIFFSLIKVFLNNKYYPNLILLAYCLITNYYYARVGFDRYLFPSFIILNFFSIYGLFTILYTIREYVFKQDYKF